MRAPTTDLTAAATRIHDMRRLALVAVLVAATGVAFTDVAAAPSSRAMVGTGIVAMTATPRPMLALCRANTLLRPFCPGRIPAGGSASEAKQGYYCMTRDPRRQTVRQQRLLFATGRCVFAEWSYENGRGLPTFTVGRELWGWDGRRWVPDEWSLVPPPLHVGIDIQASFGSPRTLTLRSGPPAPKARALDDALLDPARNRPVSLGWVRWGGIRGQLELTPRGPCGTGDELVLYLPPNAQRVSYTIALDAWLPAIRLTGPRLHRVFSVQPGPALPRVIATLERLVESSSSS